MKKLIYILLFLPLGLLGQVISSPVYFAPGTAAPSYQNLCLWSEDLSNAVWVKDNCTITVNQANDMDGQPTVDRINYAITDDYLYQNDIPVTAGVTYDLSWDAMIGTTTFMIYSITDLQEVAYITAPTSYEEEVSAIVMTRVTKSFLVPVGCTTIRVALFRDGMTGTAFIGRVQVALPGKSYIKTEGSIVP